jgi:hypothetical protein
MKKLYLILIFLIGHTLTAQTWDWLFAPAVTIDEEFGSSAGVSAIQYDGQGNVYMNCLSTHSSITFGNETFSGASIFGRNFLVKFNPAGSIQWVKSHSANSSISTAAMAADPGGNIYSAGEFTGNFNYEGYIFDIEEAFYNSFISKTAGDGTTQWIKHLKVNGNPVNQDQYINRFIRIYDLARDSAGNLFVCGQMRGTEGVFGNITLPVQGEADTFIAKYGANGEVLWAKSVVEYGYQGPRHIACDNMGNAYLVGGHSGDGTMILNGAAVGGGTSHIFLVKYSPTGEILWTQTHGGSSTSDIYESGITVDSNNNVYIGGSLNYPTINFGRFTVTTPSTTQIQGFVLKYNSGGSVQWVNATGVTGEIRDVKAGGNGNVYVLGLFASPSITLGQTVLTNEGIINGYVANIDEAGNYQWVEKLGGNRHAEYQLCADNLNNAIYTAGFYDHIRLGTQTFISTPPDNVFIAKFSIDALSALQFKDARLKVYPNPAREILNISTIENLGYYINDVMGRTVAKGYAEFGTIDVSQLQPGSYFLNTNGASTKFIKE